jgi:hypothetical protein
VTPRGRKCQVVDTNVLVVANQRSTASRACASSCATALVNIKKFGAIVIDDGDRILSEYRGYCSVSGQPGIGDSFIRWIHDNRGRQELVEVVGIIPTEGGLSFVEFPKHEELAKFDHADKKFVAVANAHRNKPHILQASDSKWWGWKNSLMSCGITVEFLCPNEIQKTFERKFGARARP